FLLLSFFAALLVSAAPPFPRTLKDACDSLDYYIAHRDRFLEPQGRSLDSLRLRARKVHGRPHVERMELYRTLGDAYRAVNLDSAIKYYSLAIEAGKMHKPVDKRLEGALLKLRLRRDAVLPLRGVAHEALMDFIDINPDSITDSLSRRTYFQGGIDLYTNIASIYPEGPEQEAYKAKAVQFVDSLLRYVRPHGLSYRFTNAHRWKLTGDHSEAIAELLDTLPHLSGSPAIVATGADLVARYYDQLPAREDESLYYQTLSAINDIKGGHREITSLQRLGEEWYERGDVERAYRYLSLALGEAVASGSSARVLESSKSLPLIARSFGEHDRRNRLLLITLVVILLLALAIILAMTAFLYRDHRRSRRLSAHLAELNKSKDFYIQNVMMLCSVFFERLDEFNRYVGRKIKANQVKDLYESIESRKYLSTQTEEFFKSFDATFRTIHPNFATQLNAILREDRQLPVPEPGEPMTPEMRIAAFMRLGIDDSAILAKFLGLSLNTIYTYRNRLKNRAVSRETFEEDVKKVGF
nr:hypothetical protein [Muribaculaceae bacterium]